MLLHAPLDTDGKFTTYSCPAPSGACNLKSQALKYFRGPNTSFDTPFETFAEQRKRKREEKERELKAAAEVQRAALMRALPPTPFVRSESAARCTSA